MKAFLPLLALVTSLAACAGANSHVEATAGFDRPIPPRILIPISRADDRGEFAPLDESAALYEPLGLPNLRTTAFQSGVREIRIYEGLLIGNPHSGLIVREANGKVTGRLFRYWPRNDSTFYKDLDLEAVFERDEAHRCAPPVRGTKASVCTVIFVKEPDWRALLASLDQLHAWELPDESRVPKSGHVVDGWVIRVEARHDTVYRRYQYHNPQVYQPPYGPSASQMMWIVDSLFRYTRPPANLQYIHGILVYGRDSSDFTPCGQPAESGFLEGMLYPIAKVIGDSAYRSHVGPTTALEIEAWAHRGDEPKVHYKRTFQRTWGVDSMTVARPAPNRACAH